MIRKHVFTVRTNEVIKGYNNLLTHAFYHIAHKIIASRTTGRLITTDGLSLTFNNFYSYGTCSMRFGDGTQPPTFQDSRLSIERESVTTTVSLSRVNEELIKISFTGIPSGNRNEVGLYQMIFVDTYYTVMFFRKVSTFPSGIPYTHYINFQRPLTYNVVHTFYCVLRNQNIDGAKDLSGTSFAPRVSGNYLFSDVPYLIITQNDVSFDNYLYTLPNYTAVPTDVVAFGDQYKHVVMISGYIVPASDITVKAIGVVSRYYDTAGNTRHVLTAVLIPSNPILCPAKTPSVIQVRFVGV